MEPSFRWWSRLPYQFVWSNFVVAMDVSQTECVAVRVVYVVSVVVSKIAWVEQGRRRSACAVSSLTVKDIAWLRSHLVLWFVIWDTLLYSCVVCAASFPMLLQVVDSWLLLCCLALCVLSANVWHEVAKRS